MAVCVLVISGRDADVAWNHVARVRVGTVRIQGDAATRRIDSLGIGAAAVFGKVQSAIEARCRGRRRGVIVPPPPPVAVNVIVGLLLRLLKVLDAGLNL